MYKYLIYSILLTILILFGMRVHYAYGTNVPLEGETTLYGAYNGSGDVSDVKLYALYRVKQEFGQDHWHAFDNIISKESSWTYTAKNPVSSAYGLCQTMLSLHDVPDDFIDDPYQQIDWCIEYARERFDTPKLAWRFWQEHKYW